MESMFIVAGMSKKHENAVIASLVHAGVVLHVRNERLFCPPLAGVAPKEPGVVKSAVRKRFYHQ